jgi:hypothetical protein
MLLWYVITLLLSTLQENNDFKNLWIVRDDVQFVKHIMQPGRRVSEFCKMIYGGHLENKEHFAIKKYLLIIGKKKNMQVLSHTFTYFST